MTMMDKIILGLVNRMVYMVQLKISN